MAVKDQSYTDLAGNAGSASSNTLTLTGDTKAPTVENIILSDTALKVGESATITITFSEKVKGFDVGDITAPNDTLSDLKTTDDGKTWTATWKRPPTSSA